MDRTIEITDSMAVKLPSLPNFVRSVGLNSPIRITDLSEASIRALGNAWTEALVDKRAAIHGRTTEGQKP